jgi:hypothetical protein
MLDLHTERFADAALTAFFKIVYERLFVQRVIVLHKDPFLIPCIGFSVANHNAYLLYTSLIGFGIAFCRAEKDGAKYLSLQAHCCR